MHLYTREPALTPCLHNRKNPKLSGLQTELSTTTWLPVMPASTSHLHHHTSVRMSSSKDSLALSRSSLTLLTRESSIHPSRAFSSKLVGGPSPRPPPQPSLSALSVGIGAHGQNRPHSPVCRSSLRCVSHPLDYELL